jgi:hypothetical protein
MNPTHFLRMAALCLAVSATAVEAKDEPGFTLQNAIGSDSLSVNGSVRLRYESFDNNFRPTGPVAADLFTVRTSLEVEYRTGAFKIGGELRDARIYDADASTPFGSGDVNPLEPVAAYVGLDLGKALGGVRTELTAGRFLINLGSKRLVADPGYRSAGNAFTGVRLDWTGKGKEALTLFYTYPQQREPDSVQDMLDNKVIWDRESSDLVFWGGFLSKPKIGGSVNAEVYFFGLDENDRPDNATRNRHLLTPGFRLYSKPAKGKLDGELEVAHQFGNIRASTAANARRVTVSAQTFHAELGYTFAGAWSPRLVALSDYATGDHAGSASFNRFDSLFGPRRADWGPTGIFGPLTRSNTVSVGAKFELKPSKRMDAFVEWRELWLDSATDSFSKTSVRDPAGASGRHAGRQYQARVRYWVLPGQMQIDAGGAVLAKGRFLTDAPNAPATGNSVHGYLDLNFFF